MPSAKRIVWDSADKLRATKKTKELFLKAALKIFSSSISEMDVTLKAGKTYPVKGRDKRIIKILKKIEQLEELKKSAPDISIEVNELLKILEPHAENIIRIVDDRRAFSKKLHRMEGRTAVYFSKMWLLLFVLITVLKEDYVGADIAISILQAFGLFLLVELSALPPLVTLGEKQVIRTNKSLVIGENALKSLEEGSEGKFEAWGLMMGKRARDGYDVEEIKIAPLYDDPIDLINKILDESKFSVYWGLLLWARRIDSGVAKSKDYEKYIRKIDMLNLKNIGLEDAFCEKFGLEKSELKNIIGTFHTHPSPEPTLSYIDYAFGLVMGLWIRELSGPAVSAIFVPDDMEVSTAWIVHKNRKFGKLKINCAEVG